jgi:hypothetical protein
VVSSVPVPYVVPASALASLAVTMSHALRAVVPLTLGSVVSATAGEALGVLDGVFAVVACGAGGVEDVAVLVDELQAAVTTSAATSTGAEIRGRSLMADSLRSGQRLCD